MAPRTVIIGAGVVGLFSAYALARRGANVTVIDRASGPAEGCSHANAGILAVGHATAWARPAAIGSIMRALVGREPGTRITQLMDPALWRWGVQFLNQCTDAAYAVNTDKLQRLARVSRQLTMSVEADLDLVGQLHHEGGLYLFRDTAQFTKHVASVATDEQMTLQTCEDLIAREPALARVYNQLAGGIFSAFDSVGDCHRFTCSMADTLAERFGVDFRYETPVSGFEGKGRTITGVTTDHEIIPSDKVLLATGAGTSHLTRPLGFVPAIYPVKGYSGTWKILDLSRIPRLPFVDETELLAVASYDGCLRVTAIAEFAGQDDLSLPDSRLALLRDYVARNFGNAVDAESAVFWAGQRPSTPAGPPYLGQVRQLDNLWINAGHGQLGWTMAAGCGELIARAMNNEETDIAAVSSTARWLNAL